MRRIHLSGTLAALTLLVTACGDGKQPAGASRPPATKSSEDLAHIHGLGVRDGNVYIATHYGLWIARSGERRARPMGTSRQDIMGFSLAGSDRFIGSGHPDPADADQPPSLGLIESRDGGRSWQNVSLVGEVDFHVLESSGSYIYGVNSADGRFLASDDGGRSWDRRTPPAGVFGLGIDPRDPKRVVASTEQGLFASADAGRRWHLLRDDIGGLLAWPRAAALYLVDGDGAVQVSRDGGGRWKAVGNIGGRPAAFISSDDELYAALHDGTVRVSTDGGVTWTLRASP